MQRDALLKQVFTICHDGHVNYAEVMDWTNEQRSAWFRLMKERHEAQQKAAEDAKAKNTASGPGRP